MLFPFSSKVLLRLDVSFLFRITTFLPIHPIDGRINTNKVGESRSDTDLIESNIYIYIYIYIYHLWYHTVNYIFQTSHSKHFFGFDINRRSCTVRIGLGSGDPITTIQHHPVVGGTTFSD